MQGNLRDCYLVIQNGSLAYCGKTTPTIHDFVQLIRTQRKSEWLDLAMQSSLGVSLNNMTPQSFLDRLVTMHLWEWADIEKILLSSFVLALEPMMASAGEFQLKVIQNKNEYVEISWNTIKLTLQQRQKRWNGFQSIPAGLNSVLALTQQGFEALERYQEPGSEHYQLCQVIETTIDDRSDLVLLSQRFKVDPLLLVKQLLPAIEKNWLSVSVHQAVLKKCDKATVLVVDDSEVMRKILQRMLQSDYDVHQASTAMDALAFLNQKRVDLMLLDVSMPMIDGLELCKSIRNLSQFRNLPIVMVTSRDGFFDKVKGRMAGATEYLTKPFEKAALLELADRCIKQSLQKQTSV